MALDDDQPLSGAQFARQAGTDPEKWAEAFDKEAGRLSAETGGHWPHNREERIEFLAKWFADAMEAAVKAAEPPSVDWDRLRDRLNVTLTEHGLPNLRKPSD